MVADLLGRGDERGDGHPRQGAAHADALPAGLDDLAHDQAAVRQHIDGLGQRVAHRADLPAAAQPGRVEDVGARALVGLQASDRVVEIGIAADVVLGACGEREVEVEAARGSDGRRDPLHRHLERVQLAPVVVLDRGADRAGAGDAGDGARDVLRRGPVSVLEVDRDRQARRPIERAGVLDDLVEGRGAVAPAQREGEPRARARQRLESQARQDLGRAGIPRVGDDERVTVVQRTEVGALLVLCRWHASHDARTDCGRAGGPGARPGPPERPGG